MLKKVSTDLCEMTLGDQVILQVPVSCRGGDSLTSINNLSVEVEGGALTHSNLFFCAVQQKWQCHAPSERGAARILDGRPD